MAEEIISQEFNLKNKNNKRNHFIGERNQNELMGNKQKQVPMALIYFLKLLVLAFVVTGCVSVSAFCSLFSNKICAIIAGIKNYKSIIKKKKKNHDKIVL